MVAKEITIIISVVVAIAAVFVFFFWISQTNYSKSCIGSISVTCFWMQIPTLVTGSFFYAIVNPNPSKRYVVDWSTVQF